MKLFTRRVLSVATLVALSLTSIGAMAQQRSPAPQLAAPRGLPQDWSHRHVVYRNPDTPEEAARKGTTAQWRRNYRDPRFVLALNRKLEAQALASFAPRTSQGARKGRPAPPPAPVESGIHRDWSHVLGGGTNGRGGVGTQGVYPAKFSFDISATPSCANDFVVYPTGTAGATGSGTNETRTSSFTGVPASNETLTLGAGTRAITLTVTLASNAGKNFTSGGNLTNAAINLAAAVNRWSGTTGITATNPAAGSVTFTRINAGNDTSELPITENLSNYTTAHVAGNDGSGTAGQPTIIAFNQLYNTTCNATRTNTAYPNVFWSYNTGTGAITRTSPVISYYDNGAQVAFVQSSSTNQAQLVLLKWSSAAPGTAGAPTVPTSETLANYRTCTAPCMTVITLSGTPDVSFSSPYVDYSGDVAWVGADDGTLHKFTGIFSGTPAEVTTGGFPATVSAGNALSPPVFDFGGKNVFVGSARGAASGGMLHRVDGLTGAVISSGQLAINSSRGLKASPVLDSSAQRAYAWVFNDGVLGDGVTCSATGNCQSVYQFNTAFTAGNTGTKARVGRGAGGLTATFYNGTFDDAYYTSPTPNGNLYVCGSAPTDASMAVLWKIPIVNNVMGTPIQGASVTSTGFTGDCSPVSEIKNGTNEYLYMSLPDHATDGAASVCGTGLATDSCLYMFNLNQLGVDSNETWVYTFSGGGAAHNLGQTITLNGTVITATATNNSAAPPYTFRAQGSAANDGDDLTLVAGALSGTTGINVNNVGAVVTFTNVAVGNVPDNTITHALGPNFTLTSHTDGGTASSTAWATTNVPAAGLITIGATGGFIMDNISTTIGTSQIYFSNTGSDCDTVTAGTQLCGNAYQASQSGLQ